MVVSWWSGQARAGNEAPSSKSPPTLSGAAVEGGTLTASAGAWGGEHLVFTYVWQRCSAAGTSCAPILGATSETGVPLDFYSLTQADVGSRIEVVVTAANAAGSAVATSNQSGPVAASTSLVAEGTLQRYMLYSGAVARSQPVYVYLPPGYDPHLRPGYPVLYLLHGNPGGPGSFIGGVPAGPTEDALLARHLMQPTILVMPLGAPDPITESSWADGVGPSAAWETFLTRDVVDWVDSRFDTDPVAASRGIAGLSDGGYGALNIVIHHPNEFRLVESWSGYEYADPSEVGVYGSDPSRLAANSPAVTLGRVAGALRRGGVYFWITVGWQDAERFENAQFASQLTRERINHAFLLLSGSHDPSVYRDELPAALVTASHHLGEQRALTATATPHSTRGGARVQFVLAQQGTPNLAPAPGITAIHAAGSGVIDFPPRFNRVSSTEQDAIGVRGSLALTLTGTGYTSRLQLQLRPGAIGARETHTETATMLALPAVITSSTDPTCGRGAAGYVELEHAVAAGATTNTLFIDLRSACSLDLGFDNAPWRNLPPTAFQLSLHARAH